MEFIRQLLSVAFFFENFALVLSDSYLLKSLRLKKQAQIVVQKND